MKIETNRIWYLIANSRSGGRCIDIREKHDHSPDDGSNHIVIPYESIPDVIKYLQLIIRRKKDEKKK